MTCYIAIEWYSPILPSRQYSILLFVLLGLWWSFLCYYILRSKSILKTLLDLRQCTGWGVEGEKKSGNQYLFISNPGLLLQYCIASLKCTEKPWWENPWLFLLIVLYSPLVWCQWYPGLECVTFACRLPCFLFAILSPHPGSLEQRHSQGALLSIPQLVKLTIPSLPWTVHKANHWLRDQVTATHRQPLNYGWHKVFGWSCFGQTFPGLWALSVSQRQHLPEYYQPSFQSSYNVMLSRFLSWMFLRLKCKGNWVDFKWKIFLPSQHSLK